MSGSPEPRASLPPGADLRTDVPRLLAPIATASSSTSPSTCSRGGRDDPRRLPPRLLFHLRETPCWRARPCLYATSSSAATSPMYRTQSLLPARPALFRGKARRVDAPHDAGRRRSAPRPSARAFRAPHGAPGPLGRSGATRHWRYIDTPDFGDPVEVRSGEVPVFWACGVDAAGGGDGGAAGAAAGRTSRGTCS